MIIHMNEISLPEHLLACLEEASISPQWKSTETSFLTCLPLTSFYLHWIKDNKPLAAHILQRQPSKDHKIPLSTNKHFFNTLVDTTNTQSESMAVSPLSLPQLRNTVFLMPNLWQQNILRCTRVQKCFFHVQKPRTECLLRHIAKLRKYTTIKQLCGGRLGKLKIFHLNILV